MSAPSTVGSVCVKEEVKGTEYTCGCNKCAKSE
jgi:hypothetical protein